MKRLALIALLAISSGCVPAGPYGYVEGETWSGMSVPHTPKYGGAVHKNMTRDEVLAAFGRAESINRSVGSYGVHEQWVYYGGTYIYFENGRVTSWQSSGRGKY